MSHASYEDSQIPDLIDGNNADIQALVERLRQGDPDAFARLMTQFIDPLTRFAWYLLGSRDAAEDVVQQVFVEIWERRTDLSPEIMRPYLYRAVRNRVLNERRYNDVRQRFVAEKQAQASYDSSLASTASHEDDILTTEAYRIAIGQLPERRQLAVRLRVEEEMTHAEIAEILGISSVAAQSLVARGLAELRSILWA